MSDRTAYTFEILGLPVDRQPELLAALEAIHGSPDEVSADDPATTPPGRRLYSIQWHDSPVGPTQELHEATLAVTKEHQFRVWEDPKYEWLGEVCRYCPPLGTFTAECDSGGEPHIPMTTLLHLMRTTPAQQLHAKLRELVGERWHEEWQRAASPHTPHTP